MSDIACHFVVGAATRRWETNLCKAVRELNCARRCELDGLNHLRRRDELTLAQHQLMKGAIKKKGENTQAKNTQSRNSQTF
jgi:hypothetical protein